MTRISLELIPSSIKLLEEACSLVKKSYSDYIDTINIPDLLKFNLRSYDATKISSNYFSKNIPHIKAIDFSKEDLRILEIINKRNLNEVLVIKGESPQNISEKVYPTKSTDIISLIKKEMPYTKVYAAFDQYRQSITHELDYVKEKIDAGADGFFTQPFFDLRFLEVISEQIPKTNIFWGLSPVLTENSKRYWITKNKTFFPKDFSPTLEWNTKLTKEAINLARKTNTNIYLMPIKINLEDYLSAIF